MNKFMNRRPYNYNLWVHMSSHPLKEANQTLVIFTECLPWIQENYESKWNKKVVILSLLCPGCEYTSESKKIRANNRK